MVKNHLKRLNMPKSWQIGRKLKKWVIRPNPGAHSLDDGLSLNTLIKEVLALASTSRESRNILLNKEIFVDGKIRTEKKMIVGFMDIISIPKINKHFRILFNNKGKLMAVAVDEKESKIKLSKIKNKSLVKGKFQLNLSDGRNILVDKNDYNVGDSLLLELPSQKVLSVVRLEKGCLICLTGGKHTNDFGKVEDLSADNVTYTSKSGKTFQTSSKYAFAVGKDKSLISLSE
jgi:small subunit ribosomal protein S4e